MHCVICIVFIIFSCMLLYSCRNMLIVLVLNFCFYIQTLRSLNKMNSQNQMFSFSASCCSTLIIQKMLVSF